MSPRKKPCRQSTVPPNSSPGSSLMSNNNHLSVVSTEPIEIRVVKTWIPVGKKQEPSAKSQCQELCYMFVDKHGDTIEAIADQRNKHTLTQSSKFSLAIGSTIT
ncbi:hypothetical protein Hdeb2414_s0009g00318991 [Helianthus debilis subsp. tardiflorus]